MSEQTAASLEQEAHRFFELVDALDLDGIGAMLTDDAQGVGQISRRWIRGRAALDAYFAQLKDMGFDLQSQLSDLHASTWDEVGLVTCVLDRTFKITGQHERSSAPASMIFRHQDGSWKLALIHTVPIPRQPQDWPEYFTST
jgi:ketosteroid isomerase-like protein